MIRKLAAKLPSLMLWGGAGGGVRKRDKTLAANLIVEVKSVKALAPIHEAQLMTYLKVTKLKASLLINFNEKVLTDGIKRLRI